MFHPKEKEKGNLHDAEIMFHFQGSDCLSH